MHSLTYSSCFIVIEAESEALHHYLIGCQQILGLKQTLDNLRSEVASPSNLPFNKVMHFNNATSNLC